MANKKQRTVHLSPTLWAQVDDLIDYYGDTQNEVIAQLLNNWFSEHQSEITQTKARIDGLGKKIAEIRRQADQEAKRKGKRDE